MTKAADEPVRDNFRDRIAAAQAESGFQRLAHQSLGRALTSDEQNFADALMAIYDDGVTEPGAVADKLAADGTVAPVSGGNKWTAQLLEEELQKLNKDLDEAYRENGFGA